MHLGVHRKFHEKITTRSSVGAPHMTVMISSSFSIASGSSSYLVPVPRPSARGSHQPASCIVVSHRKVLVALRSDSVHGVPTLDGVDPGKVGKRNYGFVVGNRIVDTD
ncbi:hypothetical protein FOMPIDRAFT_1054016 [Fomitopsis schrenkii]|uniref:Uncharacterized protein n=1 Tax=Fomitopsis schrenkii TaxID=2126942 RepID=S8FAR0_FOMSC|nr:hypothetical protein FOMPIDRAFT_1054016 [Fomitopsis schrenkii]